MEVTVRCHRCRTTRGLRTALVRACWGMPPWVDRPVLRRERGPLGETALTVMTEAEHIAAAPERAGWYLTPVLPHRRSRQGSTRPIGDRKLAELRDAPRLNARTERVRLACRACHAVVTPRRRDLFADADRAAHAGSADVYV